MRPKCLECAGCCDYIWIENCRYFHCYFCNRYFNIVDTKLVEIKVEDIPGASKESLDILLYSDYNGG